MSDETTLAYASFKDCGCLSMITVDRPEYARAVAKEVAAAIRKGERVEHLTVAAARLLPWRCEAHPLEESVRERRVRQTPVAQGALL